MPDFIDLGIETDPAVLVDNAIAQLTTTLEANGYGGWTPNDGNLEIILLNAIASMAADAATVATIAPAEIFRAFGTKLLGVSYNQGAAATVYTTWTLADTAGHTIPAGTYVLIAEVGFYVQADVVVAPGSSTGTVLLTAVDQGVAGNGLSTPISTVDQIDWVTSIAAIGSTSGGADPEDDTAYLDRLSTELTLQAPRPITADDYALMALTAPSSILPAGVVVGRASAIDGYDPTVTTFTGTTTNSSTTLSSVSSFTGISAGSILTGVAIPTGTTVVSINTGASTLLMSAAATGNHTAESITSTGSYGNERTVTVFVTDTAGTALSSPAMTALDTWLQGYREVNFLVYVIAPTYTPIYVTFEVKVLPGYDSASVVAAAETAVLGYLNPATWGASATRSVQKWLNTTQGFNVVRWNKLLAVIENVPGVDYCPSGSAGLSIGLSASPSGTSDLTLGGPAPLPSSNLTTPTIVGSAV